MRTSRQAYIDRQLVRALIACGDYPLPESALRDQMALSVAPPPRTAEVDSAISYQESHRRIRQIDTEYGPKWIVTDLGRDWWHAQLQGL